MYLSDPSLCLRSKLSTGTLIPKINGEAQHYALLVRFWIQLNHRSMATMCNLCVLNVKRWVVAVWKRSSQWTLPGTTFHIQRSVWTDEHDEHIQLRRWAQHIHKTSLARMQQLVDCDEVGVACYCGGIALFVHIDCVVAYAMVTLDHNKSTN